MAKSMDMKLGRRADVGNLFFEFEMAVKSDAKELDLVCYRNRTDVPATSMEVRLPSDFSRGLVPKQIA